VLFAKYNYSDQIKVEMGSWERLKMHRNFGLGNLREDTILVAFA
jgi:hypothetical protein